MAAELGVEREAPEPAPAPAVELVDDEPVDETSDPEPPSAGVWD